MANFKIEKKKYMVCMSASLRNIDTNIYIAVFESTFPKITQFFKQR